MQCKDDNLRSVQSRRRSAVIPVCCGCSEKVHLSALKLPHFAIWYMLYGHTLTYELWAKMVWQDLQSEICLMDEILAWERFLGAFKIILDSAFLEADNHSTKKEATQTHSAHICWYLLGTFAHSAALNIAWWMRQGRLVTVWWGPLVRGPSLPKVGCNCYLTVQWLAENDLKAARLLLQNPIPSWVTVAQRLLFSTVRFQMCTRFTSSCNLHPDFDNTIF